MERAEEKAIAFVRELQMEELTNSNHSGFYILPQLLGVAHKSFMAGYNEAMRWRDPLKELPGLPKDGYCQVLEKNRNGIYFFHEIRNQCDIDDLSISAECGHGIVWRPIEEGG